MLGADVGTALMARVLTLDLSWLSPLLIFAGVVLFLSRKQRRARLGATQAPGKHQTRDLGGRSQLSGSAEGGWTGVHARGALRGSVGTGSTAATGRPWNCTPSLACEWWGPWSSPLGASSIISVGSRSWPSAPCGSRCWW